MTLKQRYKELQLQRLQDKIDAFEEMIDGLKAGNSSDSKSSAGDKHETSVSMAQIEQERINRQLEQVKADYLKLKAIDCMKSHSVIGVGSLVDLGSISVFVGLALTKTTLDDKPIFGISLESELAQGLLGKRETETANVAAKSHKVIKIG